MDNPLYEPYWEDPKGNKIGISCGMRFPDYLNNLNACHEFEKKLIGLGPSALDTYELFLLAICTRAGHRIFRATAAQRCEAFLKTINKWEVQHES
jgi:hypothetical protein